MKRIFVYIAAMLILCVIDHSALRYKMPVMAILFGVVLLGDVVSKYLRLSKLSAEQKLRKGQIIVLKMLLISEPVVYCFDVLTENYESRLLFYLLLINGILESAMYERLDKKNKSTM